jgi:hypothetical protein
MEMGKAVLRVERMGKNDVRDVLECERKIAGTGIAKEMERERSSEE